MTHRIALASLIWSVSLLVSRIIGLLREALIGRILGTSGQADVYFVAFTLPDFINYLLAGGALSIILIPILASYLEQGDRDAAGRTVSNILNVMAVTVVAVLALAWLAVPWLAPVLAPGFSPDQMVRLAALTRIILPGQLFHLLGGVLSAYLQARDRHTAPAVAPIIYAVCVIAGGVLTPLDRAAEGLAWGVLVGSFLGPFLTPAIAALRLGLRWTPRFRLLDPDLRRYAFRSLPIMLGFSIVVVDDWLLRQVGSTLGSGVVAAANYAKQIIRMPTGVFAVAAGIASFPALSALIQKNDRPAAAGLLSDGLRALLVILGAVLVVLLSCGAEVSKLIYGQRITDAVHQEIGIAVAVMSLGLWGWGTQVLAARSFYALGRTWPPTLLGTLIVPVAYPVYWALGQSWGLAGMAVASSLSINVYAAGLLIWARRHYPGLGMRIAAFTSRWLPALVVGGAVGMTLKAFWPGGHPLLRLLVIGGATFFAYYLAAALLGLGRAGAESRPARIRLLVTGGGTGGHVYPGLAILEILQRTMPIGEILYVGVRGRAEEKIVPRYGLPLRFVRSAPMAGTHPVQWLRNLAQIGLGTLQSARILLTFRPHLILAAGGYVSAPVCFAAFLLRPFLGARLVVHEQNALPGLTNKVASLFASVVLVGFRDTPFFLWNNRCVLTGYPVRPAFLDLPDRPEARRQLGIDPDCTLVLVTGGSMGARAINRAVAASLPGLAAAKRKLLVVHGVGLGSPEYPSVEDTWRLARAACPEAYWPDLTKEAENPPDIVIPARSGAPLVYRMRRYLHDLPLHLAAADVVVCRAGAGSLAEVCAAGRAALVVPKRALPGDHQEYNAIHLAELDACDVIFERRDPNTSTDVVDAGEFSRRLEALLEDPVRREAMAELARSQVADRCAERISSAVANCLSGSPQNYVFDFEEPLSVRIQKQDDRLAEFLARQPADGLYRRLYTIKAEDALGSTSWAGQNRGIKLAGALGLSEHVPRIMELFRTGYPYVRRNALKALAGLEVPAELVREAVSAGLEDSYYEVRSGALRLAAVNPEACRLDQELISRLRHMIRRGEHFEVRLAALQGLPQLVDLADYLRLSAPYRFARKARFRQGLLEGLQSALRTGRYGSSEEREQIRRFIEEMMVTTSDFSPRFKLRESLSELSRRVDSNP